MTKPEGLLPIVISLDLDHGLIKKDDQILEIGADGCFILQYIIEYLLLFTAT